MAKPRHNRANSRLKWNRVESITHKLTTGIAAGQRESVARFYELYFDLLFRSARRATRRDEAFCLDVVQDAMLRIVRTIRPVKHEAQLQSWLRLVVNAVALDRLRSEKRRANREQLVAVGEARSEAPDDDTETLDWLRAQIASLDPKLVELIELRFTEGWTLSRIAERFGLSISSVDRRLRTALRTLRDQALEDDLG